MTNGLYIEARKTGNSVLSYDIVRHLYTRQRRGNVVVVADKPVVLASSVLKQWVALTRFVRRQRSSTLKSPRLHELSRVLANMEHLHMASRPSLAPQDGGVLFATLDELIASPPTCHTLYITREISESDLNLLTSRMMPHSLVVHYYWRSPQKS